MTPSPTARAYLRVSLECMHPERKAALQNALKLTEEQWAHGISGNATLKDIG